LKDSAVVCNDDPHDDRRRHAIAHREPLQRPVCAIAQEFARHQFATEAF
jgi:hypothetical protein